MNNVIEGTIMMIIGGLLMISETLINYEYALIPLVGISILFVGFIIMTSHLR